MRQLVTIRTVSELIPIEGADRIELAKVDGWQCVVQKGDFQVDDRGIFFEIDSILPSDDKRFAFLEQRKWRIKSMKLRGALSQGLLMPVSILTAKEIVGCFPPHNLTDVLRVTKFEPPMPMGGNQKGTFPTHLVPKTDQERVQNIPRELEGKRDNMFEITEKLDGTSCTIWFYSNGSIDLDKEEKDNPLQLDMCKDTLTGVASRNFEMKKVDGGVYARIFYETGLRDKLCAMRRNLAIQGEIIGPGIQKNRYDRHAVEFYVFDMFDIDAQKSLSPMERWKLTERLDLFHVPVVYWGGLNQGEHMMLTLENVLAEAEGKSALHNTQREGLVFKALDGSPSFKAISNRFLLKND